MKKTLAADGYTWCVYGAGVNGLEGCLAKAYDLNGERRIQFLGPMNKDLVVEILELVFGPICKNEAEYVCGCPAISGYWVCPSHGQGLKP